MLPLISYIATTEPETSPYSREVERKFTVEGIFGNITDISEIIRRNLVVREELPPGESYDHFWQAPGVDFLRLRENSQELTVKVTDKGTVTDRVEENVVIKWHSMPSAKRLATLLFGPSCLTIRKFFSVFEVSVAVSDHNIDMVCPATVSLYSVEGDPQHRIFLEVEAKDIVLVDTVVDALLPALFLKQEWKSLFQLFNGLELRK